MSEIGFERRAERRYFSHPDCKKYFVEFPAGPLEIGDDINIRPVNRKIGETIIKILSPTDCIIDRLVSYIHWGERREDIENAVLVAKAEGFNRAKVRKFCEKEHRPDVYDELTRLVKEN